MLDERTLRLLAHEPFGGTDRRPGLRRRTAYPGPFNGLYVNYTFGPVSASGAGANGTLVWALDIQRGEPRVIAFGFCAETVTGAALIQLQTATAHVAGSAGQSFVRNSAGVVAACPLVAATPVLLTRAGGGASGERLARVGDASAFDALYPYIATTAAHRFLRVGLQGAGTSVTNLCGVITLFYGAHLNTDRAND